MMHKDLLLGIDVGTTGTKCSVYDIHGKRVASALREYPMLHPRPGWTKQTLPGGGTQCAATCKPYFQAGT